MGRHGLITPDGSRNNVQPPIETAGMTDSVDVAFEANGDALASMSFPDYGATKCASSRTYDETHSDAI